MLIKRIVATIYDHIMTLSLTAGIYYGWFVSGEGEFIVNYLGFGYCYLISYTFQMLSLVFINNNRTPGELAVKIKMLNYDNTDPSKLKASFYYLIYPIILINSIIMLYNLFFLIVYFPLFKDSSNKMNLILSHLFKIKFISVDSNKED
ncbi:MAG: RDD family protein [Bacteroidota bacterium]